jgi:hypothetical protein
LKQNAQHLGLSNSPFLPWSEREFENHKREFGKAKKEEEMVRLRARLEDAEGRKRAGGGKLRVGECMVRKEEMEGEGEKMGGEFGGLRRWLKIVLIFGEVPGSSGDEKGKGKGKGKGAAKDTWKDISGFWCGPAPALGAAGKSPSSNSSFQVPT